MFIILALPRSRTAWLSQFLSCPPKRCGHDIAAESNSISDFMNRLARVDGTVETGAVVGWRLIRRYIPQATMIVVKRPLPEIRASLGRLGITPVAGELEGRRALLDECADAPGVTWLEYRELNDANVCRWIFETCLKRGFDPLWYAKFAHKNIQIDVAAQMKRLWERRNEIAGFKREIASELANLAQGTPCPA